MEKENLTLREKETMIEVIKKGEFAELESMSYFSSAKIKAKTAARLAEVLSYHFDEDNENNQERLYYCLDKIMDGVAKQRLIKDKRYFRFRSLNQINDYLLKEFEKIDEYNQEYYFKKISSMISQKISDENYYNICLEKIKRFYDYYHNQNTLPRELTTNFYNQILNKQEETYVKKSKTGMIKKLARTLPYTSKKERGRIIGAKLKKIDSLLANRNYQELGITETELKQLLESYDDDINKVRKIRKEHFCLTKEQLNRINEQFIIGRLTEDTLATILPDISDEVRTIILNKYTLIKTQFLNNVSVTEQELPKLDLGYHYNNFKIGTMRDAYENVINIITTISEEEAQDILFNKEIPKEILELLPLVGHIDGFNTEEMIVLLRNYPMVLNHMRKESLTQNITLNSALSHFFDFLTIAEAYNSADDITISVLGKNIVEQIRFSDKQTSKNPLDYLNVYEGMLTREYTFIPRVEGEFGDYHYESANDADRERLLIGKKCNFSCIGPGGAGEKAYYQALTGHNADVIIITDKNTNEFIARSICFRKGNYVVLAPIQGIRGIEESLYQPKFVSGIGKQMIKQSLESKDTLEYVFLSPDGRFLDDYFPIIEDSYLIDPFPHADLDEIAYLIASTKDPEDVEIDSTIPMPVIYKTKRESVRGKDEASNENLTRLKALDILLTEDSEIREEKERNFEPVNKENYDDVYMGQDWYIAIKKGKIVEEVVLPTEQEAQIKEIATLKEQLTSLNMLEEITENVTLSSNRGGKK